MSQTIRLLEDRGLVVTRTGPNGGVFVAEPGVGLRLARSIMQVSGSEVEVAEALEVRDILESAVICSAAEAAHMPPALAGMQHAMRELRAATETADFYRRNLEFHAEVAALCRNTVLRTIYRSLLDVVARDPKLAVLPGQNANCMSGGRGYIKTSLTRLRRATSRLRWRLPEHTPSMGARCAPRAAADARLAQSPTPACSGAPPPRVRVTSRKVTDGRVPGRSRWQC